MDAYDAGPICLANFEGGSVSCSGRPTVDMVMMMIETKHPDLTVVNYLKPIIVPIGLK